MARQIQDDLTGRTDLSRQYIHQVRKHRRGICSVCTRPIVAESKWLCAAHLKARRERERKRVGAKKRHYGARSYRASSSEHS